MDIGMYAKAILGFIAPAATVVIASVTEASDGGSAVTGAEWLTALCTAIVTSAAVYAVPNKTSKANPRI